MIIRPIIPAQTTTGAVRSTPGRGAAIADIWIKDRYQDWSLSLKQAMTEMDREQASYDTKAKFLKGQIENLQNNITDLVNANARDAASVRNAITKVDATTSRAETSIMQEQGRAARAAQTLEQRQAEEETRNIRFAAGEEGKLTRAKLAAARPKPEKVYNVGSKQAVIDDDVLTKKTTAARVAAFQTTKITDPEAKKYLIDILLRDEYAKARNAGKTQEEARLEAFDKVKAAHKDAASKDVVDKVAGEQGYFAKDTSDFPTDVPVPQATGTTAVRPMGGSARGVRSRMDVSQEYIDELRAKDPIAAKELEQAMQKLNILYSQQEALKAPELGSIRERARANYAREILGKTPGQMEARGADRGMLDFIANLSAEDKEDLLSRARLTPKGSRTKPLDAMEEPTKDPMLKATEAAVDAKIEQDLAKKPFPSGERPFTGKTKEGKALETTYDSSPLLIEEEVTEDLVTPTSVTPTTLIDSAPKTKELSAEDKAYWESVEQKEAARRSPSQDSAQLQFAQEILADPSSTQEERLLAQEYVDRLGSRRSRIDELATIESARGMQPDVTEVYKTTPPVAPDQQLPTPESLTEQIGKPGKSEVKPGPKIKSPVQVELDTIARYYGQARNDLNNPKLFKKYFDSSIGEKALSLYELYAVGTEYQRPSNEQLSIIKDEISRGLAFGSKDFEDAMKAYAALKSASEKGWNLSNYKEAGIIKD